MLGFENRECATWGSAKFLAKWLLQVKSPNRVFNVVHQPPPDLA